MIDSPAVCKEWADGIRSKILTIVELCSNAYSLSYSQPIRIPTFTEDWMKMVSGVILKMGASSMTWAQRKEARFQVL